MFPVSLSPVTVEKGFASDGSRSMSSHVSPAGSRVRAGSRKRHPMGGMETVGRQGTGRTPQILVSLPTWPTPSPTLLPRSPGVWRRPIPVGDREMTLSPIGLPPTSVAGEGWGLSRERERERERSRLASLQARPDLQALPALQKWSIDLGRYAAKPRQNSSPISQQPRGVIEYLQTDGRRHPPCLEVPRARLARR